jgi:hypothetical protein
MVFYPNVSLGTAMTKQTGNMKASGRMMETGISTAFEVRGRYVLLP